MKEKFKVTVYTSRLFHYNIPPDPKDFIDFWLDEFELIPREFKDSASVELEPGYDYGDLPYIDVTVSYLREETDEEEQTREKLAATAEKVREMHERSRLAQLKAKYEN